MPKFTFTCEHEHPIKKDVNISTITYESNREYLGDILEDFRDFLKGCGFHIDGEIDVVNESDKEPQITVDNNLWSLDTDNGGTITFSPYEESITLDLTDHNDYYYDTDRNR